MVNADVRAFGSPFRYIQGVDEFDNIEFYARAYGNSVFALIDSFLFESLGTRLKDVFAGTGSSLTLERFHGECSEPELERVKELAFDSGAAVVAGIGGGKTLDTAKLVASSLKKNCFAVPTSASTDAPASSMAVLYKDTGEHLRSVRLQRGTDLVLVDTKIISKAPVRLFVAGIGDALSTYFEARANEASNTENYIGRGYKRTIAGMAIARACYDTISRDALAAKIDIENGLVTETVENVIEANVLLSGLGFENTGCAGAHSLHTGFHEIPGSSAYYHGEMVAFGVLFQLVMENGDKAEIDSIAELLFSLGLPVTLRELGIDPTDENIDKIAARVMDGNSGIEAEPFKVTKDLVVSSIIATDELGARLHSRNSSKEEVR